MKKLQTLTAKQKEILSHCIEVGGYGEIERIKTLMIQTDVIEIGEFIANDKETKDFYAEILYLNTGNECGGPHYVYCQWDYKLWKCYGYEEVVELTQAIRIEFNNEVAKIYKERKKEAA